MLVAKNRFFGNFGNFDPDLIAIDASPDQAVTIFGDTDRVVGTSADDFHFVVSELFDLGRLENDGVFVAGIVRDAGFAVVVETPGQDIASLVDRKGMVGAACDRVDLFLRQAKLTWNETFGFGAFYDTTAELVLLTGSPGEDVAVNIKGKAVIGTTGDGRDLFELGDEYRGALNKDFLGEAEDTFIGL